MTNYNAILHYKTAILVFKKLCREGIINKDELTKIDTILLNKYGLCLDSIYR